MAEVIFAPFIQHYTKCPPMKALGNTVREVLEVYFQEPRRVRGYILDDQGWLRPRLALFVDGQPVADRVALSDPVHLYARVFVQPMPFDTEYENLD
jgi:molybdopterin synthase sulfur carrier subunit